MVFRQTEVNEFEPLPPLRDPTWEFKERLKELRQLRRIGVQQLADIARISSTKLTEGKESLTEILLVHLQRIANVLVLKMEIIAPKGCEPYTFTEYDSVHTVLHHGRRIRFISPDSLPKKN